MNEYVYVMSNPSLPHVVKIGFSTDCQTRLIDINSSSSSPTPFKIEKSWKVKSAIILEKNIHRQLDFCRISSNREFFGLSASKAIKSINSIIRTGLFEVEQIQDNLAFVITNSDLLGKLIRNERRKQKLTQKQIAFACGTGLRLIGEIESGKNTAQVGKIFQVLNILKIKILGKTN